MTIADVTFESMLAVKPNFSNPGRGRAYNIIDGTLSGLAVVTSSTATLIIARSIYSSTHKISKLSLRAQYTQISNIIVQSSMIYSLFLLGNAICDWLLSTRSNVSGSMIAFTNFLLTLNIVVTVCFKAWRKKHANYIRSVGSGANDNGGSTNRTKSETERHHLGYWDGRGIGPTCATGTWERTIPRRGESSHETKKYGTGK